MFPSLVSDIIGEYARGFEFDPASIKDPKDFEICTKDLVKVKTGLATVSLCPIITEAIGVTQVRFHFIRLPSHFSIEIADPDEYLLSVQFYNGTCSGNPTAFQRMSVKCCKLVGVKIEQFVSVRVDPACQTMSISIDDAPFVITHRDYKSKDVIIQLCLGSRADMRIVDNVNIPLQDLTSNLCCACKKTTPTLDVGTVKHYIDELSGWKLIEDQSKIYKRYSFPDFNDAFKFVHEIAHLAEYEGHHPDITFGYGYVEIVLYTHAIRGLSMNDFILAAKINLLF